MANLLEETRNLMPGRARSNWSLTEARKGESVSESVEGRKLASRGVEKALRRAKYFEGDAEKTAESVAQAVIENKAVMEYLWGLPKHIRSESFLRDLVRFPLDKWLRAHEGDEDPEMEGLVDEVLPMLIPSARSSAERVRKHVRFAGMRESFSGERGPIVGRERHMTAKQWGMVVNTGRGVWGNPNVIESMRFYAEKAAKEAKYKRYASTLSALADAIEAKDSQKAAKLYNKLPSNVSERFVVVAVRELLGESVVLETAGSYFDLGKRPEEGATVWALVGQMTRAPKRGVVRRVERTYHGGHFSCDFEVDGKTYRVSSDALFDHKPKKVQKQDAYGDVTVWEDIAGAPGAFAISDAPAPTPQEQVADLLDRVRSPRWEYPSWALPKVNLDEASKYGPHPQKVGAAMYRIAAMTDRRSDTYVWDGRRWFNASRAGAGRGGNAVTFDSAHEAQQEIDSKAGKAWAREHG